MKKSLIALAVLSAIAGSAVAQSSVSISGRLDAGYASKELDVKATTNSNTKTSTIGTNGYATSFIALTGTEDLGSGLKLNFRVETGLDGAATTTLGGRALWTELAGGFGSLRFGNQNTLNRDIWTGYIQTGAINIVGDLNSNTAEDAGGTAGHTAFNTAVRYTTPNMNGFSASAAITKATTDTTGVKTGSDGTSFGANYSAGKLSAAVASTKVNTDTAAIAAADAIAVMYVTSTGTVTTTATGNTVIRAAVAAVTGVSAHTVKETVNTAAVSYDFGVAKVSAIYMDKEQQKTNESTKALERDSMTYGISAPVGKAVIYAQYGTGSNKTSGGTVDADLKAYQLGARYNLSKRTFGYLATGQVKHEVSATSKNDYKETAVGLVHLF